MADWGQRMSEQGHGPAEKKRMRTALHRKQTWPPDARKPEANERADWIGKELRKVFDETVSEAVPDRLAALMAKLRDAEGEGSGP